MTLAWCIRHDVRSINRMYPASRPRLHAPSQSNRFPPDPSPKLFFKPKTSHNGPFPTNPALSATCSTRLSARVMPFALPSAEWWANHLLASSAGEFVLRHCGAAFPHRDVHFVGVGRLSVGVLSGLDAAGWVPVVLSLLSLV
jgi:hypothetical protein